MNEFKAYFISDTHLSSPEEPNTQALLRFLRELKGPAHVTHLFLLGDIFDLWIGRHNYFIERWLPVTTELLRLHQTGVQIHYFEGNHDLYLRSYFGEQLGFTVHAEACTLRLGSWTVRLEHGDQMDPEDRGYLFLRWFLRTSLMKWIQNRLPESFVVRLGKRMSRTSREYTSTQKTISDAVARQKIRVHAEKVLREKAAVTHNNRDPEFGFDYLIAGHMHVREEHSLNPATPSEKIVPLVINLGSWITDEPAVYCLVSEGGEFISLANYLSPANQ